MTALVVRGDALHLPLRDNSVDLIVTSPPYFALRAYQTGHEMEVGSEATPHAYLEALWAATREMKRVLKPTGSIWINLADTFSSGQRFDSEMTYEDAAWLAGVVDSDGSISILSRTDKGTPQHDASVYVGQKYRQVIDRIVQVTRLGSATKDEGKDLWRWRIGGQQAGWVLERIWPWLFIKRRQALAAVELTRSKQGQGAIGGKRARLTDETLRYRERLRQAVMAWNAGQVDDYEPDALPLPDLPRRARWIPAKSLLMLPQRYAIGCIDQLGLILRRDLIWDKPNGLPESVTDRPRSSHEYWFMFVKQPRYFAALDELRTPSGDDRRPGKSGAWMNGIPDVVGSSATTQDHRGRLNQYAHPLGALPGSVWSIPSEPLRLPPWIDTQHYAAFPTEWPRRLILGFTPHLICGVCGVGRFPVVERDYTSRGRTFDSHDLVSHRRAENGAKGVTEATILGYACACTPFTDHPGTGEPSGPSYAAALADGGYVRAPEDLTGYGRTSLTNRPKVGPWREYHLDRFTPPPGRPATVLDPFGGTGTVAHVARALDPPRHAISIDLSEAYCRLAADTSLGSLARQRAAKVAGRVHLERQGSLL